MPKHISARPKPKHEKIAEIDASQARKRSLMHFSKESKAERYFHFLLQSSNKVLKAKSIKPIEPKDFEKVAGLNGTYWELQHAINNNNVDAQLQHAFIDQQHDILDELEIIYNKYYERDNATRVNNRRK